MADSRFAVSNQNLLEQLKENASNCNTKKSTQTWINVWKKWANEREMNPTLEEYEPEDLDKTLQRFYAEVRTKDGDQYEPDSLRIMLSALDRHLKEQNYGYSVAKDREFYQSKLVLEGKAKLLRQEGKGKRPNAATALSATEEETLWESQKLGEHSPKVLSQTMWWILTQHFGLRGRQEHHSMTVQDFSFHKDDNGVEYITFTENPTKTRQGGLNKKRRPVLPKMFATGGSRCPVRLFREYLSRRPLELSDSGPFYLARIENPKTEVRYKNQRLGINTIDTMMKTIIKDSSVDSSSKKMTNHSARKTLVKKLRASNVERQSIIQVTGHANTKSLDDYDEGSEREQQMLSDIISKRQSTSSHAADTSASSCFQFPSAENSTSAQQTNAQALTVNNFQNCQVTFHVHQGKSSSPCLPTPKRFKRVQIIDSDSE